MLVAVTREAVCLVLQNRLGSRTQAVFSGLSDGAPIAYFYLFYLLPVKLGTSSENRDLLN